MVHRFAQLVLASSMVASSLTGCEHPIPADVARRILEVDSRLLSDVSTPGSSPDWLTYGRDYDNSRFAPQQDIRRANVDSLVLRFSWRTGAGTSGSFESSPLVVDGIMYLTTPRQEVIAFDLRRRREVWRYRHRSTAKLPLCCGSVNRGAALGFGTVFFGTLDAHLGAVDAITGRRRWSVSLGSPADGYSITMAPLVVDSLVVIATAGSEFGIRGHVSAFHVRTGSLVWRWFTIPSPSEGGWWGRWSATTPTGEQLRRDLPRERTDSARYPDTWKTGGGGVWTTPAYDAASHRLFLGVGNPWPQFDGSVRPGDNLYTESIVALDARTGRLVWYYQCVPHDNWEMDVASPPAIIREGARTFVVQAGKTGWLYILDARDGSLVARSEAFVPQENMFARLTHEAVAIAPGPAGGASWSPVSWSPMTKYVYVVGAHQPNWYVIDRRNTPPGTHGLEGHTARTEQPEWGTITALDVPSGRIAWQVRTDQPMVGGSLVTAGALVFTGEGNGWFRAYDATSGKTLWGYRADAGVNAPPVSFTLDGEQLVAVAAGGNGLLGYPLGDEVLVFGLPTRD
jgi:PQQ-dependent dehydrogenase (methanol/ethanol family)